MLLIMAGLSLTALPAVAQFGSIVRDETPRPPGNIPDERSSPNKFPQFPRPPSFPSERESRPLPPPYPSPQQSPRQLERLPVPTNLPPVQQPRPPGGDRRDDSIQSQPLPPPPGSTAAPQEASPGQPPGTAPGQEAAAGTPTAPGEPGLPSAEVVVEPPPQRIANPTAVFAGLDKITGRITSFDVAIDETVQFGALRVTPRACYSRPPTETPRTDAFLDVDEVTLQGEVRRIFTGWMFASSPGLHAVEHPIYDIWLKDCKGGKLEVAGSESDQPQRQAQPAPRTRRR
jgi:hypothetical protein